MNTHRRGGINLLALIPHRDIRKRLRAWSGELFAAGMAGAWSFPWAAPLACLSRPLTAGELRDAAFALREFTGGGGKFWTRPPAASPFPAFFVPRRPDGASGEPGGWGPAVYGPGLDPGGFEQALREIAASKAAGWFSPPVLGAAIVDAGGPETGMPPDTAFPAPFRAPLPEPPALSFRAAALANMLFIPLDAGDRARSFEWCIGPLRWLPPVKKTTDPEDRL
ncbi:MAG: hypothetical protein LBE14_05540 [Treponema sp.]|jgi:hypothetical protein|nr:hypothetical protein [Treponema sp.]